MKKVFVPKGEIVHHDYLYTDKLIVKGVLLVSGKIVAKEIIGGGVIEAREIVCGNIQANVVTADFIHCRKIAANKLFVRFECWANDCMAVSDFIGAGYVSTGNLSVSLSDIKAVDADKIITLPQKRRGLLGLLWASWWKSLFMSLFYGGIEEQADDAEPENVQAESAADSAEDNPANEAAANQYGVMSEMVGSILDSLRQNGYQISKIETPDTGTKNAAA